jgi:hypothetical protein
VAVNFGGVLRRGLGIDFDRLARVDYVYGFGGMTSFLGLVFFEAFDSGSLYVSIAFPAAKVKPDAESDENGPDCDSDADSSTGAGGKTVRGRCRSFVYC